jgi:beta-glucanase (GH16 family)
LFSSKHSRTALALLSLVVLSLFLILHSPHTSPPEPNQGSGFQVTPESAAQTPTPGSLQVETRVVPGQETPLATRSPLPIMPNSQSGAWALTFSDDFNGNSLDTSKWNTSFWWGHIRDYELAYYADDAVGVEDGVLALQADRRQQEGYSYTSGVVTTLGKFSQKYGFFEVRCKMPQGKGLWPAVWLLPDAGNHTIWPPEIDVVEYLGNQPNVALMNLHYVAQNVAHGQTSREYQGPDFSQDFHTFGIQWTPSAVTWFVDGTEKHKVQENIPNLNMYLITNLAVGDWAGQPDASTQFPARLQIDYARVWQSHASPR